MNNSERVADLFAKYIRENGNTRNSSNFDKPKYTKEEFLKKHFGNLNLNQIKEALKEKYPEEFI